jgi:TPR repeat protein
VKRYAQPELDLLFQRADHQWELGNLRSAFRLFLAAAKGGDPGGQSNLGNFYSGGIGVKPNQDRALYWYRRAYRQGCGGAAANIGDVFRKEHKPKQALAWFERAVKLGFDDAKLDIAKIHLANNDKTKAIRYLKEVQKASQGSLAEASREEAQRLLKHLGVARPVAHAISAQRPHA